MRPAASAPSSDGRFSIESRPLGRGVLVALHGELDLASADTAAAEVRRVEQNHKLVAIDLRGLSFIDSSGLHLLLKARERLQSAGGRLVVVQGPPAVSRALEIMGMLDVLEVVSDPDSLDPGTAQ